MPPALYALAVATFTIGTTEFVVVGLIPDIAADLGVSIPTGLLATPYASIAMAIIALLIATFALRPQPAIVDSNVA